MFYQPRSCETCKITRPSKASHCDKCNYCVHGYDHHCVALNNCIGRRNIRSFYTFLLASVSYVLTNIFTCIVQITTWDCMIGFASEIILFVLTVSFMIKPRCGVTNNVRIGVFIVGSITSMTIAQIFSKTLNERASAILLIASIGYFAFILEFVREYVLLVSRHLSQKEQVARKRTAKETCSKDEFKGKKLSFSESVSMQWQFLIVQMIPYSNYPKLNLKK